MAATEGRATFLASIPAETTVARPEGTGLRPGPPYRSTRIGLQRRVTPHLALVLLPLPTLLLAGWALVGWRFNGLYGQDPFAYYDYGIGPLRRSLLHGTPLTAMFWPLGYPVLITLSSLLLGPGTGAGQLVNLIAAGSAVVLTYLLGRDLLLRAGADARLARLAGALGALLLGLSGRLIESSLLIMADAVALATALLSAWALVRWTAVLEDPESDAGPGVGWLALSAAALAWSVVTRWGQAALVVPWLLAALPAIRARGTEVWRALPWAVIPAVAIVGAQLWLVFTVRPDPTLGPHPFAGDLALVSGAGSAWSPLHLFQRSFVNADGVERYIRPNVLFYAGGPFLSQYLTPLFLPAVLLGLAVIARAYRRALLLLLAWPVTLLLFDAGLAEQNPRFVLAALPPIAIIAGVGLATLWRALRPSLRPAAVALLAAGLLAVAASGWREMTTLNRERNADLQVASWTAARVPAGATTLSFGITLTLQHATGLRVLDLSVLSRSDLRRLIALRRPLYLVVQEGVMTGQFAARQPGINFRTLRRDPGLIPFGRLHGYSFSRVRSP